MVDKLSNLSIIVGFELLYYLYIAKYPAEIPAGASSRSRKILRNFSPDSAMKGVILETTLNHIFQQLPDSRAKYQFEKAIASFKQQGFELPPGYQFNKEAPSYSEALVLLKEVEQAVEQKMKLIAQNLLAYRQIAYNQGIDTFDFLWTDVDLKRFQFEQAFQPVKAHPADEFQLTDAEPQPAGVEETDDRQSAEADSETPASQQFWEYELPNDTEGQIGRILLVVGILLSSFLNSSQDLTNQQTRLEMTPVEFALLPIQQLLLFGLGALASEPQNSEGVLAERSPNGVSSASVNSAGVSSAHSNPARLGAASLQIGPIASANTLSDSASASGLGIGAAVPTSRVNALNSERKPSDDGNDASSAKKQTVESREDIDRKTSGNDLDDFNNLVSTPEEEVLDRAPIKDINIGDINLEDINPDFEKPGIVRKIGSINIKKVNLEDINPDDAPSNDKLSNDQPDDQPDDKPPAGGSPVNPSKPSDSGSGGLEELPDSEPNEQPKSDRLVPESGNGSGTHHGARRDDEVSRDLPSDGEKNRDLKDGGHILPISSQDTVRIRNFDGTGRGVSPDEATIANVDTLKFRGAGLSAKNLILTQNGSDLAIAFEGKSQPLVILEHFNLEDLDNLTEATWASETIGNILFDGQTEIQDSFDVLNADEQRTAVYRANTITFLNDLNNTTQGLDDSDDVINGQGGNDVLTGRSGNDLLRGGQGNDTLLGGDGDDVLVGGFGKDILNGGEGRDRFVLSPGGTGTIQDFHIGSDRIQLTEGILPSQLHIVQDGNNTRIDFNQQTLAVLINVQANVFSAHAQTLFIV